jgi:hypothetical protein
VTQRLSFLNLQDDLIFWHGAYSRFVGDSQDPHSHWGTYCALQHTDVVTAKLHHSGKIIKFVYPVFIKLINQLLQIWKHKLDVNYTSTDVFLIYV